MPEEVIGHHLQHIAGCRRMLRTCIIVFEHGKVDGSRQKNAGRRLIRCESQDVGRNWAYTYMLIRFRPPYPIVDVIIGIVCRQVHFLRVCHGRVEFGWLVGEVWACAKAELVMGVDI